MTAWRDAEMIGLIEDNREAITALCEQYGVRRLAVFGSAAQGTFDPKTSDLDFVIDFADYGLGVSRRFIDFANALESLFGLPVDLVFERKLTNPWFRKEVLSTMEVLVDDEGRDSSAA
jgi:predicted nucleotidyltransferase